MRKLRADEGFGLTEVMIAMLILMILLVAMLSVLITAINTAADNGTRGTAAQAVQQRLEDARSVAAQGDCAQLISTVTASSTVEDGRGIVITISGAVDDSMYCGSSPSGVNLLAGVTVTATTTAPGFTNPMVQTRTDVLVKEEEW